MYTIKVLYEYLFYFFYRGVSIAKPQFALKWKAATVMLIGELMILTSVLNYYTDFTKSDILSEKRSPILILLAAAPFIFIKFWVFDRRDQWKIYIAKFEAWPKQKRSRWDLLMWVIVLFVFGNLIFSFYLMSRVDWAKYR